jgi:hypothetical protein
MTDHPFDKTDLIAYVTGSCAEVKRLAIERHLHTCDSCRAYCDGLASEKDAFLATHPFEETITLPTRKATVIRFPVRQYVALAASLVICVASGFLYFANKSSNDYRIKGERVALKAYVQNRQGGIEKRKEQTYSPGEKIQFLYSCEAENRFLLLGIDAHGAVTQYFPAASDSSIDLERGRDLPLPNSIVLDDYTGREAFLGVFSRRPLYVPEVKKRLSDSYAATRSLDSVAIKGIDAVVLRFDCKIVVQQGRPQ